MTAPFIPPPDFSGLAQLGEAIRDIIDPGFKQRQQVQQFLLANPAVGAQFAEGQRQADEEFFGTEERPPSPELGRADVEAPNVLAPFGFKPEQARRILQAFPRTAAQETEAEFRKLGGPAIEARRAFEGARGEIAKSELERLSSEALIRNEVPSLAAVKTRVELALGRRLLEDEDERLTDWQAHLAQMKTTNPVRYRQLLEATRAEPFVRFLLESRRLDIESAKAKAATTGDPLELLKIRLDVMKNLRDESAAFRKAMEDGTQAEQLAAFNRLNSAAAFARALAPGEPSFELAPRERLFRGLGVRFTPLAPPTLPIGDREIFERLLSVFENNSRRDFGELQAELMAAPEAAEFLGRLSPQDRQAFIENARRLHGETRASGGSLREQIEAGEGVGTAEERARRGVEAERESGRARAEREQRVAALEKEIEDLQTQISGLGTEPEATRQKLILRGRLVDKTRELGRLRRPTAPPTVVPGLPIRP